MCAIVGHIAAPDGRADHQGVTRAANHMHHRGPDGHGLRDLGSACLGHRRLSVIDVANSAQPWVSADGRYTLVFNGEIYNYRELRVELQSEGYVFRSAGDTEVLLETFRRYGTECLDRFNGMFAFAIWDAHERCLFAARDRVGKKPFYYGCDGNGLMFASELAALRHFPSLDLRFDLDAVHDFFAYQFIGGERSAFAGVRKLRPGHYLSYKGGKLTTRCYWRPPRPDSSRAWHAHEERLLAEELRGLITDAVRLRLRSDVPLGAFLSGGIDSAIVVSAMTELGADVRTFTIGFDGDRSFDERDDARALARQLRTTHHEHAADLAPNATLDRCLAHLGEPMSDPSCVPTWHLCAHARESVTVALSGDGADELFAGYQRYRARAMIDRYRCIPRVLRRRIIEPMINVLPEPERYYGSSRVKQLRLAVAMARRIEECPQDFTAQVFSASERARLLDPDLVTVRCSDDVARYELSGMDPVTQMQMTDVHQYLSEDILTKVDRMSMAHSLEVRSPLLDHRVVEFATRLDPHWKLQSRAAGSKYLLRRAYAQVLPSAVLRRRKHGFAVPLGRWFRGPMREVFQDQVLGTACPEFLQRKEIDRLWNQHQSGAVDHGFKLWSLLSFFKWKTALERERCDAGRNSAAEEPV